MSKEKQFFQCDLSQDTGRDRAFIEARGAIVGNRVELGGQGTGDYWIVDSVSDKSFSESEVKALQDGHHKGFASIS